MKKGTFVDTLGIQLQELLTLTLTPALSQSCYVQWLHMQLYGFEASDVFVVYHQD